MLATILRETRLRQKMSMSELALKAGVTISTLSRYENGWSVPTLETAERLASVLGGTAKDVFAGESLKPRWRFTSVTGAPAADGKQGGR